MKRETTILIVTVLALTLIGVLMVYSASSATPSLADKMSRHTVFALAGVVLMIIASRVDYHKYANPVLWRMIAGFALVLLLLVLIPGLGRKVDGARRWLFGFQPSEFAKFALIVWLSVKLTLWHEDRGRFWRGFVPPFCIGCIFAGLVVLERDLGVPVMMMAVTFLMMCVAGIRWRYLIGAVAPGVAAVAGLIIVAPHRIERIIAFINPWAYREGSGWQLIQSLSGFAQGGVLGRGAGASEQKLGYLPAAHTDFIFAVIGEELGLIGTLAVLLLFALFIHAAFRVVANAPDRFGTMLATGISGMIGGQAVFVMMVTIGLLPTKGLPLPFISYGGTALLIFLAMAGVLVNISSQAQTAPPECSLIAAPKRVASAH